MKCGMIAGAGNVVIFDRICSWGAGKVASAARRVAVCVFMVGSWSDHPRIILGDRSRVRMRRQPFFVILSDLGV